MSERRGTGVDRPTDPGELLPLLPPEPEPGSGLVEQAPAPPGATVNGLLAAAEQVQAACREHDWLLRLIGGLPFECGSWSAGRPGR